MFSDNPIFMGYFFIYRTLGPRLHVPGRHCRLTCHKYPMRFRVPISAKYLYLGPVP